MKALRRRVARGVCGVRPTNRECAATAPVPTEPLERRTLLSTLEITGTVNDDTIDVFISNISYYFVVNGSTGKAARWTSTTGRSWTR